MEDKIKAFIGRAEFDASCGFIFGVDKNGGMQHIADVRGWGAIQNLFKDDLQYAAKFQDDMGKFIADAINEKINPLPLYPYG